MFKLRRGNAVITLSDEEMREVYYAYKKDLQLADAECHLREYFGMKDVQYENVLKEPDNFHKEYGFPFDSLLAKDSPNYLLEKLVNMYEKIEDCNVDENNTWETAIEIVWEEFIKQK